jgi:simple sugar transport system ATP-binding protein
MQPALQLRGIRKSFGDFVALDGADFTVQRGEIHALLGENGAGKSSLMNVASGLYSPDAGRMWISGAEVRLSGPLEAAGYGVGMIHQHYKLVRPLTVAENVLLGLPGRRYRSGLKEVSAAIAEHSHAIGFEIDANRRVDTLSIAEQQRVEILKALVGGSRILILDEPTAVLTDEEAGRLLMTMRALAARGAAIVLVTHKLRDVQDHADCVTVMRGGRTVATLDPRSVSAAELTEQVVGAAAPVLARTSIAPGMSQLSVKDLVCARADGHVTVDGLSLEVRAHQIYGIAGVGGNGQTELVEALMGVRPANSGILIAGDAGDIRTASPARRRDFGFAAIPADRQAYALAGALSVTDNFAVTRVRTGRFGSWVRVNRCRMAKETTAAVAEYEVKGVRDLEQPARLLSGGNAQKLVIAREFAIAPKVVIAHSPSRGLDIRACADVHRRLMEARAAGAAVLLISEDLEEILALSDRIGVMNRGRIVAEFDAPALRQQVGEAMVGHA